MLTFVWVTLLAGCATQTASLLQDRPSGLPPHVELTTTPFHPQELYQCGPAALATTLQAAGFAVTPEQLVGQVYVPERRGSLQPEMLAAGRRHGAFSATIPPRLDALLTEVGAGTPVLVLQNLGLAAYPLWHYAVVIGYDLDREQIILRSGTTEREIMPISTFEHTWARSNYWAMVTTDPQALPRTVAEQEAVPALVALERILKPQQAQAAYASALERWPGNALLHFGFGNVAYAAGDKPAAVTALRRATELAPDSAPAFNNLATVLAELGQYDAARVAADRALALGGQWANAARLTRANVERMATGQ